jgi:hypothetical protein
MIHIPSLFHVVVFSVGNGKLLLSFFLSFDVRRYTREDGSSSSVSNLTAPVRVSLA